MREDKFTEKNLNKWQKLESYNNILKRKGMSGLTQEEIKDFAGLYRNLSHHLSYARTNFKGSNITNYLNQIIGTSHNYIFVRDEKGLSDFKSYGTGGLLKALGENFKYIFLAFAVFMAGFLFAMVLVLNEPVYGNYFYPGVDPSQFNISPDGSDSWSYGLLSSIIMTNNIRVSFLAFALGITAGIGTVYVMFYNGMVLGALTAIVMTAGISLRQFYAMILPHGFLELTAIFISGGAGLMIGLSLLIPGNMKRRDSVIKASKKAAYFIPAIVLILIAAGIIEGFFTPLAVHYTLKLAFAFVTLFIIAFYFYMAGRIYRNIPKA